MKMVALLISMLSGAAVEMNNEELAEEDNHYPQTVSTILQHNASRTATLSTPAVGFLLEQSPNSAFTRWRGDQLIRLPAEGASQLMLKYVLFSLPFLHDKCQDIDGNSPKASDEGNGSRFRKSTPQDELSANHVLAERRRREKLNERFIVLRSLVPFVTKVPFHLL